MTTVEIKDYYTDAVLYTHEPAIERAAAGFALRDAMEAASLAGVNLAGANLPRANLFRANLAGANLAGADLARANLAGAYLPRANLFRANLAGADLTGANLACAYLAGAYLAGVDLAGADLTGADLTGANLAGADLADTNLAGANLADGLLAVSKRPLLQIGPIGSRSAQLSIWLTEKCVYAQTGCFWGPLDDFEAEVRAKYASDSTHGHEYAAAIALARSHAQHWTPITTTAAE